MPLPISIAVCEQYVFKRDFVDKKWINVNPEGKACVVKFLKKGDQFYMKISPQGGGQDFEYAVSRDIKLLYNADGFIQIPLLDVKELYGIKFNVPADGETFYAKIVNHMDLGWSAPKTTIGPDNLPHPAVNFGPTPPQTLPPSAHSAVRFQDQRENQRPIGHSSMIPNQFGNHLPPTSVASNPGVTVRNQFGNQPSAPHNPGPPRNQFGNQPPAPLAHNPGPPRNQFGNQPPAPLAHNPGPQRNQFGNQSPAPLAHNPGPPRNQFGNQPPAHNPGIAMPPSMQYQQDPMQQPIARNKPPPRGMSPQDNQFRQQGQFGNQGDFGGYGHQGNMRQPGGGGYQDGYQMQSPGQPLNLVGDSQRFQTNSPREDNRPMAPYTPPQNSPTDQYQQQPRDQFNNVRGQVNHPAGGFDYQGQPRHQGNYYDNPNAAPLRAQAPPARTQKVKQNVQPNPAPKKPREAEPVTAEQLPMVAASLMTAINVGNKENAEHLLNMALLAKANLKIEFEESEKPTPANEFILDVIVEFQQPRKKPLDLFLDHVHETDNVFDLQVEVERRFFIPRSSQNWIIGKKLIKGEDELKKPLSDHGLKYAGDSTSTSARVFLYVMHTKKANVAKEEYDAIQSRRKEQQNRLQQNSQPERQPPPTSGPLPGNINQRAFPQGQHMDMGGPPQGQPAGDPNQSSFPQGYTQDQRYGGHPPQEYGGQPVQSYHGNVPGNQGNMIQQQQQMQGMGGGSDDPTYDRIGKRGFDPGFTDSGVPKFRVHQDPPPQAQPNMYYQGNEPVYEQLSVHGRPNPAVRNPPPQQGLSQQAFIPRGPMPNIQQGGGAVPQSQQQILGYPAQLVNTPAQEAPPEPPKEPEGWSCPTCTFVNRPRRPGCEQCATARPDNYVVPEDEPPDTLQLEAQKNDVLFQEYEQHEKERKAEQALKNYQALIEAEDAEVVTNKEEFDCLICYVPTEPGEGVILRECLHQFCKLCLHDTIMNAPTVVVNCPFDDGNYTCQVAISEREMRVVLTDEELESVHRRGLREAESASPNSFHCKTADCGGFCFYEDAVNEFQCPVCAKRNCLLCKAIHEGMDCKEYQDDLKRRAADDEAAQATQNMLEELVKNGEAMNCPKCKIIVQKKDGCDWIRCSMCRTEICWATKGARWGPKGHGDISEGCRCRVNGKKCHPLCRNCH